MRRSSSSPMNSGELLRHQNQQNIDIDKDKNKDKDRDSDSDEELAMELCSPLKRIRTLGRKQQPNRGPVNEFDTLLLSKTFNSTLKCMYEKKRKQEQEVTLNRQITKESPKSKFKSKVDPRATESIAPYISRISSPKSLSPSRTPLLLPSLPSLFEQHQHQHQQQQQMVERHYPHLYYPSEPELSSESGSETSKSNTYSKSRSQPTSPSPHPYRPRSITTPKTTTTTTTTTSATSTSSPNLNINTPQLRKYNKNYNNNYISPRKNTNSNIKSTPSQQHSQQPSHQHSQHLQQPSQHSQQHLQQHLQQPSQQPPQQHSQQNLQQPPQHPRIKANPYLTKSPSNAHAHAHAHHPQQQEQQPDGSSESTDSSKSNIRDFSCTPQKRFLRAYAKLISLNSSYQEHLICKKLYSIGGKKLCDLELIDRVRKNYALIRYHSSGKITLEPMSDTSIKINNLIIQQPTLLKSGDQIRIVDHQFLFQLMDQSMDNIFAESPAMNGNDVDMDSVDNNEVNLDDKGNAAGHNLLNSFQQHVQQVYIAKNHSHSNSQSQTRAQAQDSSHYGWNFLEDNESVNSTPLGSPVHSPTSVTPLPTYNNNDSNNSNIDNNIQSRLQNVNTKPFSIDTNTSLFGNYIFTLSPMLTNFDYLSNLIKANGGAITSEISDRRNHLYIVPDIIVFTHKLPTLHKKNFKCVKESWVQVSLQKEHLLPFNDYLFKIKKLHIYRVFSIFPSTSNENDPEYINLKELIEKEIQFHGSTVVDFDKKTTFQSLVLAIQDVTPEDIKNNHAEDCYIIKLNWLHHCIETKKFISPTSNSNFLYHQPQLKG